MGSGRSVGVVLGEVEALFAALGRLDLTALTGEELAAVVVQVQRVRSMADAAAVVVAGAFEVSKAWSVDGASSATTWIQHGCRVPRARASEVVATARWLRSMPAVHDAFVAGGITLEQVRLLASAQRTAPEAFAADGEARLLDAAGVLGFAQFETAVRYWRHLHAPDDAERSAHQRWLDRRVHCSTTFEGMVVIDALLDPVTGAIVSGELDRLTRLELDADLAEARQRLGTRDVPLHELRRTAAQRRADALRVMAERSAAKPPGSVEPRVLLHVLAGHESVLRMCELSNGQVLTPGEVLPLLDRTDVERAIFESPSKVIDIGRRQRLFTGATRTAIQLRDRGCTHPYCDRPFDQCEIDHIIEHTNGGPTTQDNGRCLCKHHHRRHRPD